MLQILRLVQQQRTMRLLHFFQTEAYNHVPHIPFLPHILVAHISSGIHGRFFFNYRIQIRLHPFHQCFILRECHTYSHFVTTGSVKQTRNSSIVNHCTSRPDAVLVIRTIRSQCRFFFRPVQQIRTGEMSPVYLTQQNGRCILLVENVIFPVMEKQPVSFVGPIGRRQQMILRSVEIICKADFRNSQYRNLLQQSIHLRYSRHLAVDTDFVNQTVNGGNIVHADSLFIKSFTYQQG